MIVSCLQTSIQWLDPLANQQQAEQMMLHAPHSDLYVLPEMWTMGFVTNPDTTTLVDSQQTIEWMLRMAQHMDAAVAGSVMVSLADGTLRNRFLFVTPDEVYHYDKRHLFTYGGENAHYTPGADRIVVEWRGVRLLLQVCYDLRFPVFARNRSDYDVALYVANWPDSRRRVWDTLLRARAIENQCYVIGVNRVGDDTQCHYDGGTAIIDAYGRTVVAAADDTPQTVTATLDMEKLMQFRKKFPVLADGDDFNIS